ncbi:MAG: hypothetical protein V2G41_09590 [bacterium JZ-2024 1]
MWIKGFNFRATAAFVGDGANEVYVLGDVYPTSRGGATFGWTTSIGGNTRDRSSSVDRRLAGVNFSDDAVSQNFRVDLPAPGKYRIRVALGDASFAYNNSQVIEIFDSGVSKLRIPATGKQSTAAGSFMDAVGTVLTAANWPPQNQYVEIVFSTTQANFLIGPAAPSNSTTLAHIGLEQVNNPSSVIEVRFGFALAA